MMTMHIKSDMVTGLSTTVTKESIMFPFQLAASATPPRPVSPQPDSSPTSSLANTFAGASTSAGTASPSNALEFSVRNVLGIGSYFVARDLVRISGVSKELNHEIRCGVLPEKLLGTDTASCRDRFGSHTEFRTFINERAQLPYTSFEDTVINAKKVDYDQTRHGIRPEARHCRPRYERSTISRDWGTVAEHGNTSVKLTNNGEDHAIIWEPPLKEGSSPTGLTPYLSPDGRICVLTTMGDDGRIEMRMWRRDTAGNWQQGASVKNLKDFYDIHVLDSGAVFMLSQRHDVPKGSILHCWQPDKGLREVPLDFDGGSFFDDVASDGARLLLECHMDVEDGGKRKHIFLIELNSTDTDKAYDYCDLNFESENNQYYQPQSKSRFSSDGEVLAIPKFNDKNELGGYEVLFVNVPDALSSTAAGAVINLDNPAVARKSETQRYSGNRHIDFKFSSDDLTFLAIEPSAVEVKEISFPYMARGLAIETALTRMRVPDVELPVDDPEVESHPLMLEALRKMEAELGIEPGKGIKPWDSISGGSPLQKIVEPQGGLAQNSSPVWMRHEIAKNVQEIKRVAAEEPVTRRLEKLKQPLREIGYFSTVEEFREIGATADEAVRQIVKSEQEIAEVRAGLALTMPPRVPVPPRTETELNRSII